MTDQHRHDLMGVTEIAELLGLTRQRVHQLRQSEDFPRPVADISAGSIWERADVEAWARESGRI
ncbi:MAG: DNA-binding protein [Nocardioides sp.]|uniref:helix-turn-helix transcriptional regulator n=1 Tax=Nocardioides sp. TaxID=35761 RepID=UPI002392C226|nr:DNA-binding protein [Nocardioides sp.]MDE0778276.1 DNA-binding protein [Nocardioides sp.]